jgi:hypothetical protein
LIGLLMIRDEEDVLEETLRNHIRFCDEILVLDGTEGEGQQSSERAARACAQVREYHRDRDSGLPLPLRDGARQFLLERARSLYGRGNWYALLHGDEIWPEDPRRFLSFMPAVCDAMRVRLYHFFPHTSQRDSWDFRPGRSIEQLATWYMLPSIAAEARIFYDGGESNFDVNRHSRTVPIGVNLSQSECVVKQYNYRTPQQAARRAAQRTRDGWQTRHYSHLLGDEASFFCDSLERPDQPWENLVPIGTGIATHVGVRPLPVWGD